MAYTTEGPGVMKGPDDGFIPGQFVQRQEPVAHPMQVKDVIVDSLQGAADVRSNQIRHQIGTFIGILPPSVCLPLLLQLLTRPVE